MVIVRIKGGLGNQLFQYAAAYSLAKRVKQELVIDTSFFPTQTLRGYKLSLLNVEYTDQIKKLPISVEIEKNRYINRALRYMNIRQLGGKIKYLLETRSEIVPEFFSINGENIYIDGYYQSEKYFVDYKKELLSQFTPKYRIENEYINQFDIIKKCNSVAIHVRRGDFLNAKVNSKSNRYVLGNDYYKRAIIEMNKRLEMPVFFWFSDDIDWVKNNFGNADNFHFVSLSTNHPDIDEMMLMSECKNIITANSTFSWWAAWMSKSDGIVICPARRYGNIEMIPSSWMKV